MDLPKLPLGKGVRVLKTHKAGLFALEKPEGALAHPNESSESKRALLNAPYNDEKECYEVDDLEVHLLHRLDSPTSGVILVATDRRLAKAIREAFREHLIQKVYTAVVCGIVRRKQGTWTDNLSKQRGKGHVRATLGGEQDAVCGFKFLPKAKSGGLLHLLELRPQTGRTHQLRIQCAKHGYPIAGDRTYGDFKRNAHVRKSIGENRLFLHASSVSIDFFYLGKKFTFFAESDVPESFKSVCG